MKRAGVVLIVILAFCGIADSAYIAQSEITGTPLICTVENFSGCNIVATNGYSYLFGIPVAEYGIFFYGIIFVLAALELCIFDELLRRALLGLSLVGVAVSLYLALLEAFVIRAFCIYCVASMFLAFCIALLAVFVHITQKKAKTQPPHAPLLMPPAG